MTAEQDQQAGAYALEQAAKDLERMWTLGGTPRKDMTDREWEEYEQFSRYAGDYPAWLRARAKKPTRTAPPREYGVALKLVGVRRWQYPTDTYGGLRDAEKLHESIVTRVSPAVVIAAKVVSRTKAGAWEFEDGEE